MFNCITHSLTLSSDLIQCTHEPNVSIPSMANLLMDRALAAAPPLLLQQQQQSGVTNPMMMTMMMGGGSGSGAPPGGGNWVIVVKCLTTIHHLMCYGNERFSHYLASAPTIESGLKNIVMRLNQVSPSTSYEDPHPFVSRYASYLLVRISTFRSVGFDFAKVRRSAAATTSDGHQQQQQQQQQQESRNPLSHLSGSKSKPPIISQLPLDQVLELTPQLQVIFTHL